MLGDFNSQGATIAAAAAGIDIISELGPSQTLASLLARLSFYVPNVIQANLFFPVGLDPDCPIFACYDTGPYVLFFIEGCRTNLQGQNCWNGYIGNIFGFNGIGASNSENLWFSQKFATILAALQTTPLGLSILTKPWKVFGHSAGGNIGQYASQYNLQASQAAGTQPFLVAYGSPSPGMPQYLARTNTLNWVMWTLSDDPVPLIPPPLTFSQRWWASLTYGQGNRIAEFTRWPFAIQVDLNFDISNVDIPSQVGPNPTGSVQSWLASTAAGVQTVHSVATYVARLQAARAKVAVPATPIPDVLPPMPPPVVNPTVVRGIIQGAVRTSFGDGRAAADVPVAIPPSEMFTVRRIQTVYYVYFGGILVGVGPTRRGAHQLARVGNSLLRSIQGRAAIDTAAFASQFETYLADAVNPAGTFRPVLIDGV